MRMILALICGGLLGLERSKSGRAAGFRTYALVALAASALVASLEAAARSGALDLSLSHSSANGMVDAQSRLIQGLLTGIGFLGAGVIVRDGLNVRGLTTAASVWLTSAIGVVSGLGLVGVAVFITLLGLLILTIFRKIENLVPRDYYAEVIVRIPAEGTLTDESVKEILTSMGFRIDGYALRLLPQRILEVECNIYYKQPTALGLFSKHLLSLKEQILSFEVTPSSGGNK